MATLCFKNQCKISYCKEMKGAGRNLWNWKECSCADPCLVISSGKNTGMSPIFLCKKLESISSVSSVSHCHPWEPV